MSPISTTYTVSQFGNALEGESDRVKVRIVAQELGYDSMSAYLRDRIRRDYARLLRRQQAEKGAK